MLRDFPVPMQNSIWMGFGLPPSQSPKQGRKLLTGRKGQLCLRSGDAGLEGKEHLEIYPNNCSFGHDEHRSKTATGCAHVGGLPLVKSRGCNQE